MNRKKTTEPFVRVPQSLLLFQQNDANPLSSGALLVFIGLMSFCYSEERLKVFPSATLLGKRLNISSANTITRLTNELVEKGWIAKSSGKIGPYSQFKHCIYDLAPGFKKLSELGKSNPITSRLATMTEDEDF